MASHALGAIQDVAYDRAAGIASVATVLGARDDGARRHRHVPGERRPAGVPRRRRPRRRGGHAGLRGARGVGRACGRTSRRPAAPGARFMGLNLPAGALVTELLLDRWGVQADVAFVTVVAAVCVAAATLALIAHRAPPRAGRLGDAQAFLARAGRDRLRRAADGNVTDLVRPRADLAPRRPGDPGRRRRRARDRPRGGARAPRHRGRARTRPSARRTRRRTTGGRHET